MNRVRLRFPHAISPHPLGDREWDLILHGEHCHYETVDLVHRCVLISCAKVIETGWVHLNPWHREPTDILVFLFAHFTATTVRFLNSLPQLLRWFHEPSNIV